MKWGKKHFSARIYKKSCLIDKLHLSLWHYDSWAGNRVFPNGFLEMELERGEELVIWGAPEEARSFTLNCNGKSIPAEFDGEGKFVLPLSPGEGKIRLRLSKRGAAYPRFYAVLTRDDG